MFSPKSAFWFKTSRDSIPLCEGFCKDQTLFSEYILLKFSEGELPIFGVYGIQEGISVSNLPCAEVRKMSEGWWLLDSG